MKFNNQFVTDTLLEAADIAATKISQNFALKSIAENGSCTLDECQNMYELAYRAISEGSEDLIPENLELPDATDSTDPMAAQDAQVDADVESAEDGDLDLSDLEGIVLPDSEGNQYIIQGGILVPYEEESSEEMGGAVAGEDLAGGDLAGGDDAPMVAGDGDDDSGNPLEDKEDEELDESTGVVSTDVQAIEETTSVFANNSSIVSNLLKNVQFTK